jgi:hypothetical protein
VAPVATDASTVAALDEIDASFGHQVNVDGIAYLEWTAPGYPDRWFEVPLPID